MKLYIKSLLLLYLIPFTLIPLTLGAMEQEPIRIITKDQIESDSFDKIELELEARPVQWIRALHNCAQDLTDAEGKRLTLDDTQKAKSVVRPGVIPLRMVTTAEFKALYQYIKNIAQRYDYDMESMPACKYLEDLLLEQLNTQALTIEALSTLLRTADMLEAQVFVDATIPALATYLTQPEQLKHYIHNPAPLHAFCNTLTEYDHYDLARAISENGKFNEFLTPSKTLWTIFATEPLSNYVLSQDGNVIAYRTDTNLISVWHRNSPHPFIITTSFVMTEKTLLDINAQGNRLVVANGSQVYIFNLETGGLVRELPHLTDNVLHIAINNEGTVIAMASSNHFVLYKVVENDTYVTDILKPIKKLRFSLDGRQLAIYNNNITHFCMHHKFKEIRLVDPQNPNIIFSSIVGASHSGIPALDPSRYPQFFAEQPCYLRQHKDKILVQKDDGTDIYKSAQANLTVQQTLLIQAITTEIQKMHGPDYNLFIGQYAHANPYNLKIIVSPEAYAYWVEHIKTMPEYLNDSIKQLIGGKTIGQYLQNQLLYLAGKGLFPLDKTLKNSKYTAQYVIRLTSFYTTTVLLASASLSVILDEILLSM